jgi:hypothetical protein
VLGDVKETVYVVEEDENEQDIVRVSVRRSRALLVLLQPSLAFARKKR